jgi:hypothetical protein
MIYSTDKKGKAGNSVTAWENESKGEKKTKYVQIVLCKSRKMENGTWEDKELKVFADDLGIIINELQQAEKAVKAKGYATTKTKRE